MKDDVYHVSKGNDGWEINGPDCICLTIGGDYLNADLAKRTCEHLNIAYGMGFKYGGEDERHDLEKRHRRGMSIRIRRVALVAGVVGLFFGVMCDPKSVGGNVVKLIAFIASLAIVMIAAPGRRIRMSNRKSSGKVSELLSGVAVCIFATSVDFYFREPTPFHAGLAAFCGAVCIYWIAMRAAYLVIEKIGEKWESK